MLPGPAGVTVQKRRGTDRLGWCLDDLHDKCPRITPNMGLRCGCPCHTDTPVPAQEDPSEPVLC